MTAPADDDPFYAELRACTAELARIIDGDLDRPVPACPGWTFRQLATHVGRGHRWAAQIVATRATVPVSTRDVPNGKLPDDPAQHGPWLKESADLVAEAVTAVGDEPVWTFTGPRPARWWARRRAHEAAVHLADAQLAAGQDVDLDPGFAADGVDEWLGLVVATTIDPARARELGGDGQTLHFHATDPGLSEHGGVAGHPHAVRPHRRARPRQGRRRGPRPGRPPAAPPHPPDPGRRSRRRGPRRSGAAHPLARHTPF